MEWYLKTSENISLSKTTYIIEEKLTFRLIYSIVFGMFTPFIITFLFIIYTHNNIRISMDTTNGSQTGGCKMYKYILLYLFYFIFIFSYLHLSKFNIMCNSI